MDSLRGSNGSEMSALHAQGLDVDLINDEEFCEFLDEHIFLCPQCGWWCDIDEMEDAEEDEPICTDCGFENQERADLADAERDC